MTKNSYSNISYHKNGQDFSDILYILEKHICLVTLLQKLRFQEDHIYTFEMQTLYKTL